MFLKVLIYLLHYIVLLNKYVVFQPRCLTGLLLCRFTVDKLGYTGWEYTLWTVRRVENILKIQRRVVLARRHTVAAITLAN